MICGIYNQDRSPVDCEHLAAMVDALSCYGPDGSGIWCDGHIGFGHVMLHTTPESLNETLPFYDPESQLAITADARIDNRGELFESLGIHHQDRAGMTDSFLILKAYEKWGEDCPSHLLGGFAFAIWNKRRETLFCARDHVGEKSFFYWNSGKTFVFSAAYKGLWCIPKIQKRINEGEIANLLANIATVEKDTFYREIYRVQSGNILNVSPRIARTSRYWSHDSIRQIKLGSDVEYFQAFKDILFEAVRCRLRSNSTPGIWLSGGLDSSSVACIAAHQLREENKSLHAFCRAPLQHYTFKSVPEKIPDEYYARVVAQRERNITLSISRAEGSEPLSSFETLISITNQPKIPCDHLFWFIEMAKAVKEKNIKVLLVGTHGNSTISFNGKGYFADLATQFQFRKLYKEISLLKKNSDDHGIYKDIRFNILPYLVSPRFVSLYRKIRLSGSACHSIINPNLFKKYIAPQQSKNSYFNQAQSERKTLTQFLRCKSMDLNTGREWPYPFGLYFGFESRDPTSDKRVIEFCLGLPDTFFIREGHSRTLVRKGLQGIIPAEVQTRIQVGDQSEDVLDRLGKEWDKLEHLVSEFEQNGNISMYLQFTAVKKAFQSVKNALQSRIIPWHDLILLLNGVQTGMFVKSVIS